MPRAYIGLGSNLQQPKQQIKQAIRALELLVDGTLPACSSLYSSQPMGPQDQAPYVNAIAAIDTLLEPLALLKALQTIEVAQGRVREGERWGARTLDLDIILYDDVVLKTPELEIPHYGMKQREFVLYPLAEIAPDLILPCHTPLQTLLQACPLNGLQVLPEDRN